MLNIHIEKECNEPRNTFFYCKIKSGTFVSLDIEHWEKCNSNYLFVLTHAYLHGYTYMGIISEKIFMTKYM